MKILHVNYYDVRGGAALAAYRLCQKQRELGIDAQMVVAEKFSDSPWVIPLPHGMVRKMHFLQHAEALWNRIAGKGGNFLPFSLNLFSVGAGDFIERIPCDVLHLHWINGQMLSIGELPRFSRPVVWTLHDNWAYCGAEHYHLQGDERFVRGYEGWHTEDLVWKRKKNLWKDFFPVIVGPSRWISREAEASQLFQKRRVEHIYNGIASEHFFPRLQAEARRYWGLSAEGPVIVTGAASLGDENKGGKLLRDTLAHFPDTTVLAVGKNVSGELHPKVLSAGSVSDPAILAMAYCAGDLFLSVARYDNLPNMLVESVACGTPVVAVDTGGVNEIVSAGNGITAPPDPQALAAAIGRILRKEITFSPSAAVFDITKAAGSYLELYRSIAGH